MQIPATVKSRMQFVLETILPTVLLACKLYALNTRMLYLGSYTWPMLCFSLVLMCGIGLLVRTVLRRDNVPVFFVLYGILSALMLVDSVYCGYTGKLPSAVMLQYAGLLDDVKETIYNNVTCTRLLYAIDVPLWIVYFTHFRKKWFGGTDRYTHARAGGIYLAAVTGLSAAVCIGYCLFTPFIPSYFKSEILTYHTLDFLSLALPERETVPMLPAFGEGGSVQTGAQTDPYRGIAAGRNVITIQVEALQNFVLGLTYNGQEVTPNLNALLAADTLYFDNYYYQIGGGNTADAEFAVNNSLYAPDTEAAYSKYPDNDYYSMATLLKDNGYKTAAVFHGYLRNFWSREGAYPGQGFDTYLSGSDYFANPDEVAGMGVSDGEFFVRAVDWLREQEGPFYAFMITLSSHHAFELDERFSTLVLEEEHVGTLFGNYLQSIHYLDTAVGMLIEALRGAGLYENSILTFYGDHFGLPVYNWQSKAYLTELLGREYTYAEHFNVPLIIHMPGTGVTETVSVAGGHIDVMPTLLHLLGLENEKGIMFGDNLLLVQENVVCQQTHLARGSFISDGVLYQSPFSGVAVNAKANAIDTWEVLDPSQFHDTSQAAKEEIEMCMYLLEHDLILIEKYEAAVAAQDN